ncbi:nickel pincer cofactor biosynthesis protein LarC [Bacillus sp. FJAT-29953]|uniref:Pyridinium-3,5-bisthiocarboxylic acid mononucleotide nickel insertion protein n=2 Tax=Neobacillus rhizophilus TaxID=2833579 RepID=A0A942U6C1_9BACI|nr:nickel pincer cofactor biosynthesis protein LarC [Neobacillus rhizophilus]MBU8916578.1 nickel pincer cofactor biosynthesis protein LarC [Bacillus sp. FJAT-29953]
MKTLYFDCTFGIAGDRALAALIDLGADISYIVDHLRKLPIEPFGIEVHNRTNQGIAAKKISIFYQSEKNQHQSTHEISKIIAESELPVKTMECSLAIFHEFANAKGKLNGIDSNEVYFEIASIIEIIGFCLALESLEITEILASPVPAGFGHKMTVQGSYPIPAPTTLELLKGIPLAELNLKGELTTPTGAAILRALVKKFMPIGGLIVDKVGYGAGEKDHPNVLRALLISPSDIQPTPKTVTNQDRESIYILEAQLDDMTGEGLGFAMERLLAAGALDVFYTPVYMKKNRPGTLVTVLVSLNLADRCEQILLEETTTLGVRRSMWSRNILDRRFIEVETPYGPIKVKQACRGNKILHQAPEYEDVARAAREQQVAFQLVYQYAMKLAMSQMGE